MSQPTEREWEPKHENLVNLIGKEKLEAEISSLKWSTDLKASFPFSQGYAIRACVQAWRLPLSAYAWGGVNGPDPSDHRQTASFGLIAVEGDFNNATVRFYLLDGGVDLTLIAKDITPKLPPATPTA